MKFARSIPASIGAAVILTLAPLTATAAPGVQPKKETETTSKTTEAKPEKLQNFNIDENSDFESQAAAIQHFVTEKDGQKKFDEQAAKAAGASDFLLEAGREYNTIAENNNEADALKVHGNYCGPGQSGPGAPVDKLDELCQKHDNCYGERGYFACSCDRELQGDIILNSAKFKTKEERAAAAAIFAYFSNAPCIKDWVSWLK